MNAALQPEDTRDALRKIGGLLFGVGALMLFIRKSSEWADFPVFLNLAIPAVLLYGGALRTLRDTGGLRPWQAVYSVLGLIFVPLALAQFVQLVGGTPGASLNTFWIFGVTAALAAYAGIVAGVRVQLLLASIATIIAWSALWDKIIGISDHVGVYRGLLGILAILFVVAGLRVWRADGTRGGNRARGVDRGRGGDGDDGLLAFSDLLSGAGIAALIACGLGITSAVALFPFGNVNFQVIETTWYWDILLLAVSIGLIAIGSRIGTRGPVYVGAVGLVLFLIIVGLDLNEKPPHPDRLGLWPLVLLIGGGAAIAASLSEGVSLGNRPRDTVRRLRG